MIVKNIIYVPLLRERKIQEIQYSFEACNTRPVHATNENLQPVEVLPLFHDFDRYELTLIQSVCNFY